MDAGEIVIYILGLGLGLAFLIYLEIESRKIKKKRPELINRAHKLCKGMQNKYPTLKITYSHAIKHDYYKKMGYYPNLSGVYKGRKVFVLHRTGKGALPNRIRFHTNHLSSFNSEFRITPKRIAWATSKVSSGNKQVIKSSTGSEFLISYKPDLNPDSGFVQFIVDKISHLNEKVSVFTCLLDLLSVEIQTSGYIKDIGTFEEALNVLGEICSEAENYFGMIEEKDQFKNVELQTLSLKYKRAVLSLGTLYLYDKKGRVKEIRKDEILFLYHVTNMVEVYGEDWFKITLNEGDISKIHKLRLWMMESNGNNLNEGRIPIVSGE